MEGLQWKDQVSLDSLVYLGQVKWQLLNLSVVVLPQISQKLGVSRSSQVYRDSLTAQTSRPADTVDVLRSTGR